MCPVHLLTEQTAASTIADLVLLIGAEKANVLCESFGGSTLRFPKDTAGVTSAIGAEAADAMHGLFGGGSFYVPVRSLSLQCRTSEVIRLRRTGLPIAEIASRMRMTERNVYRLLAPYKRARSARAAATR